MLLINNGFGEKLAKVLAKLVTLNNILPQGSPASPILSNAILYNFDGVISRFASENRLKYTRYADDMTISGNNKNNIQNCIKLIRKEIHKCGLDIKEEKTRIASRGGQQRVTGVVVNNKLLPSRKLRRQLRAMFHQAQLNPHLANIKQLKGYYSYLNSYKALKHTLELQKYHQIISHSFKEDEM